MIPSWVWTEFSYHLCYPRREGHPSNKNYPTRIILVEQAVTL